MLSSMNAGGMLRLIAAGLALWADVIPCQARQWRLYENCKLIPNESNDGDSFHVRYNKREYIFRLYFVDTPESESSLRERVAEQAAYWGIDERTSIQLGKEAAKFTARFLADGFTVYSKLSDARGRSDKDRDYAVVMAGNKDLAVELVRNGYARVFGEGVEYPDGTSEQTIWWRLKSAEREARKNKAGGWGLVTPAGTKFDQLNPVPAIAEQTLILPRTIAVFSLEDPGRQVGWLQSGAKINVLKAESPTMVRIRFAGSENKIYEAQCRRTDLGL